MLKKSKKWHIFSTGSPVIHGSFKSPHICTGGSLVLYRETPKIARNAIQNKCRAIHPIYMDSIWELLCWYIYIYLHLQYTPPKINIEPENDGLEDVFPFPGVYSQVPC